MAYGLLYAFPTWTLHDEIVFGCTQSGLGSCVSNRVCRNQTTALIRCASDTVGNSLSGSFGPGVYLWVAVEDLEERRMPETFLMYDVTSRCLTFTHASHIRKVFVKE